MQTPKDAPEESRILIRERKKSCWYRYFMHPGLTQEIMHELSSSDRYGEFQHWFRMPLSKVEDLTNILIDRGYIIPPRTYWRRAVFHERSELLVMSPLYLLGTGAAFRSCKPLCGISTSEVQKFFTHSSKLWWIWKMNIFVFLGI